VTRRLALLLLLLGACARRDLAREPPEVRPAPRDGGVRPPPPKLVYPGDGPEATAKNLVLRYNELLAFGYWHLDMNHLQEVASVPRAEKAYHHMAALGEGRVKLRSYLRDLAFTAVDATPGRVVLTTREVWDFAFHDLETGVVRDQQRGFVYLVTYTVVAQPGGRWLITDVGARGEGEPAARP
jgi:hypothetical protein